MRLKAVHRGRRERPVSLRLLSIPNEGLERVRLVLQLGDDLRARIRHARVRELRLNLRQGLLLASKVRFALLQRGLRRRARDDAGVQSVRRRLEGGGERVELFLKLAKLLRLGTRDERLSQLLAQRNG